MTVSTRADEAHGAATHDSARGPANSGLQRSSLDSIAAAEDDLPTAEGAAESDTVGDDDRSTPDSGALRHRLTRPRQAGRIFVFVILPVVAMLLAGGAGFLKYQDNSQSELWRAQSVQAATDGTVAMLSYRPDTVDRVLADAQSRLTGDFRESYASLTHDVVIPGAKERQISAIASVPAAASMSATETDAVVLVFVNQTTVMGTEAPTDSASTVKVTLTKIGDDWLIAGFDPI